MKKKMNAKQKREEQKLRMQEKYSGEKSCEVKEETHETTETPSKELKKPRTRRSSAKVAGLKSAFILSDSEVLMTSFGRGNDAVIEKYISGNEITSLNSAPAFEAARSEEVYSLKGRKEGTVDDPLRHNDERIARTSDKIPQLPGMDILGLKPELEKRFFNTEDGFNDNIHIQMIYNILDIEKILAPHINNISYVINNLKRDNDPDSDFVGTIGLRNSYRTFTDPEHSELEEKKINNVKNTKASFDRLMGMSQRAYLGDALFNTKLGKGKKESTDDFKRYYYTLSLIGEARQALFHGKEEWQTSIYQLGPEYDGSASWKDTDPIARKEAREVLDEIYSSRVRELNSEFLKNAGRDLSTIFRVYKADTPEKKREYVRKYYDFIVRKEQKNLGFSLKKLREIILEGADGKAVLDNCAQSMRSKFVKNFDFASSLYYQDHPERITAMVEGLRGSATDEEQEAIYRNEADRLWTSIRDLVLNHILPVMNPDEFRKLKEDKDVTIDMISDIAISKDADYFSKFIYMMTLFMDGKEINELVTQLISKFESIASFIYVMKERELYGSLSEEYAMFDRSDRIAKELRVINSFARMQKESPLAKKAMFVEAAQILGFNGSEDDMEDYLELILTKDAQTKAELQKKFRNLPRPNKGFRNFIANNVIESSRFKYLVRYADPATIKELAKNDQVLKLVLKEIPDEQIARYYVSCVNNEPASPEAMRDELRRIIRKLTFTDFSEVEQSANAERNADKQKKQAVIRLYLTVLYLAVKNLVKINARYTLAFHCFERDYKLLTGKNFNRNKPDRYNELTEKYIDEKRLNKKSRAYLKVNIDNSDGAVIVKYRNQIAHLNMVRSVGELVSGLKKTDSYFALYHYLMQKAIIKECRKMDADEYEKINETIRNDYFSSVELYGKYRKDFVKALNVPFGYNLARYKNLSIEGLFDMHNPGEPGNGEPDGE